MLYIDFNKYYASLPHGLNDDPFAINEAINNRPVFKIPTQKKMLLDEHLVPESVFPELPMYSTFKQASGINYMQRSKNDYFGGNKPMCRYHFIVAEYSGLNDTAINLRISDDHTEFNEKVAGAMIAGAFIPREYWNYIDDDVLHVDVIVPAAYAEIDDVFDEIIDAATTSDTVIKLTSEGIENRMKFAVRGTSSLLWDGNKALQYATVAPLARNVSFFMYPRRISRSIAETVLRNGFAESINVLSGGRINLDEDDIAAINELLVLSNRRGLLALENAYANEFPLNDKQKDIAKLGHYLDAKDNARAIETETISAFRGAQASMTHYDAIKKIPVVAAEFREEDNEIIEAVFAGVPVEDLMG